MNVTLCKFPWPVPVTWKQLDCNFKSPIHVIIGHYTFNSVIMFPQCQFLYYLANYRSWNSEISDNRNRLNVIKDLCCSTWPVAGGYFVKMSVCADWMLLQSILSLVCAHYLSPCLLFHHLLSPTCRYDSPGTPHLRADEGMGLLPDTQHCGLRMRREHRERFFRHRLRRKTVFSEPGMHHGTCVMHVPWCMSGSLTCGGGENVPGIPGACATRNVTYLARGPWGWGNDMAWQAWY